MLPAQNLLLAQKILLAQNLLPAQNLLLAQKFLPSQNLLPALKFLLAQNLLQAQMSRDMRFPTMWYVRPAKAQTILRIRANRSEPLLVA